MLSDTAGPGIAYLDAPPLSLEDRKCPKRSGISAKFRFDCVDHVPSAAAVILDREQNCRVRIGFCKLCQWLLAAALFRLGLRVRNIARLHA